MKFQKLTFALMLTSALTACTSAPEVKTVETASRTAETDNLFANLINLHEQGYMYGHHDDPCYGHTWKYEDGRSDVKEVCGDYPGLMTFDMGHIELGDSENLDGVPFDLIRSESVKQFERGGVVSYSWHLNNPKTGGDSWDVSDSTVVASILEGGENHEKFVSWLGKIADFINSVKTADGVKVPVIFRPWHEHTGSWFWWGQALCSTEEYKALWDLTVSELKANGVDNVLLAYSPGTECDGNADKYMERYPGDEIVDVLGLDCYSYGDPADPNTTTNFKQNLSNNLNMVCKLAEEHHKIAALTETGIESVPVENWWTFALQEVCDQLSIAYAQTWRNAHDKPEHFFGPYPGHISADDFVKFYQAPKTLFAGDLKGLYDVNE